MVKLETISKPNTLIHARGVKQRVCRSRWMFRGHTGPLVLGVGNGEWEAAASRTVDVPHLMVQKHPRRPTLAALSLPPGAPTPRAL